jgi:integrase
MTDPSGSAPDSDGNADSDADSDPGELAPPPLSSEGLQIGNDRADPEGSPNGESESDAGASETEALEAPQRLRELQESLSRLEDFAAQSQAENTTRAYAADLEDFRHWCKQYDREWLPAQPKTIGLYLGARADDLSLATLERRLAAIASLHKEEGYESPASVAEGPLRKIWKGIVREKTRQQDGAPPLMVEDLRSIIEHLPRYSSSDDGPTGRLTLTALRDRALLLVGWTGALRRSELVALTTSDVEFVEGEGKRLRSPLEKRSGRHGARQGPALRVQQGDLPGHRPSAVASGGRPTGRWIF